MRLLLFLAFFGAFDRQRNQLEPKQGWKIHKRMGPRPDLISDLLYSSPFSTAIKLFFIKTVDDITRKPPACLEKLPLEIVLKLKQLNLAS